MKKNIKKSMLIVVSLFLYSCIDPYSFEDGYHSYFIFENKANIDIAVDTHNGSNYASDTMLVSKSSIGANSDMVISANSTHKRTLTLRHDSWESLFVTINMTR